MEFPDNVHALIAARLDTLSAVRKSLHAGRRGHRQGLLVRCAGRDVREDPSRTWSRIFTSSRGRSSFGPRELSTMEGEAEYRLLARARPRRRVRRRSREPSGRGGTRRWRVGSRRRLRAASRTSPRCSRTTALPRWSSHGELRPRTTPDTGTSLNTRAGVTFGWPPTGPWPRRSQAEALLAQGARADPASGRPRSPGRRSRRWADAANQNAQYEEAAQAHRVADAEHSELPGIPSNWPRPWCDSPRSPTARGGSPLSIAAEAVALLDDRPGPLLLEALARLARYQWLAGYQAAGRSRPSTMPPCRRRARSATAVTGAGFRGLARAERGDPEGIAEAEDALRGSS